SGAPSIARMAVRRCICTHLDSEGKTRGDDCRAGNCTLQLRTWASPVCHSYNDFSRENPGKFSDSAKMRRVDPVVLTARNVTGSAGMPAEIFPTYAPTSASSWI